MPWGRFELAGWLFSSVVACACSSNGEKESAPQPSGWLTLTLSEPAGGRHCTAAAPTPYEFGSEEEPLVGQVSCAVHVAEDTWFSGYLAHSRTGSAGSNVVFVMDTKQNLAISLATDLTGTLELDASADCAPTFTAIVGNAVSAEFDCPLLGDPNDPTSGCGVSGTVQFENCTTE